jgi:hypothetical protein
MLHLLALVILIGYVGALGAVTVDVARVVLGGGTWESPSWTGPLAMCLMVASLVLAVDVLATR